jgi:uncharacterized protein (TIGR02099 family)
MHNPDDQALHAEHAEHAHLPLVERWRRARACYRMANLASHHVLGFTIKLGLLVYFGFAILFLFLRYAILPNIDYYKGDIERLASAALGNQVSIARIYASWRGLRPNLFLGDVVLRDGQGRQVLTLPSVSATLSWWSVLAAEPRFESLDIIRPELHVRREADGTLYIAGILLDSGPGGDHRGAEWAFKQRQMVVREGRLHWTDAQRGVAPLVLENVNMMLTNQWTRHRFGLQATPPASLAGPIDVRADFEHPRFGVRVSDTAQWKGEAYTELREADLGALKDYLDYPFQLTRGRGALRAWVSVDHAALTGFTADVGLVDVSARFGRELPQLDLARVSGRVAARAQGSPVAGAPLAAFGAHGHTLTVTDFAIETTDGLKLPATTVSESYTEGKGTQPDAFVVKASQLDLETLAELATQFPLTPTQRTLLEDLAPRGRLNDFALEWRGRYPAIASWRVKGRMAGLGMRAQPARAAQAASATTAAQAALPALPGFQNLSGSIDASEQGGAVTVATRALALQMPAWFADPAMTLDALDVQARWSYVDKRQLLVQLDSVGLVQGKLHASLSGSHLMAPPGAAAKDLGTINLEGKLGGFAINTIDRFLPLQTPPELRAWLVGALEGGTAQDVSVRLRGPLAQFPFRATTPGERARGEFRVAGRIENGRLNYTPGHFGHDGKAPMWPQAEQINGSFVFDRTRMEIRGNTASTLGVPLTNVVAVVPDLSVHDMMLDIDGSASGPLQDFLHYVQASPVTDFISHFTEDTRGTGNARLALKLHLPLSHLIDAKVQGTLQLAGNDVVLFPELPPLQASLGKIEFNERGVNLNGVGASFLGGPLALSGGSQRDGSILIKLGGTMSVDGLKKNYPAAAMQRLATHLDGGARYAGTVLAKDHQVVVTVDSTLNGLGIALPLPARKAGADAMPLHVVVTSNAANEAGLARDEIRIGLGAGIAARYQRQKQGKGAWTVQRGGIGVNVPAPEPDSGMAINVNLKTLNVDQWIALGSEIAGGAAAKPEAARAREDGELDLDQYVVPDSMAARATELIVGERKLDNVVVGASHQKGTWQASVDSRQASGYVTWSESATGVGKVTARLSSLIIPESSEADVKELLESGKSAAASIPALDIVAERFELFNKQLGRLELVAANSLAQAGREWHINKLSLANPDGELTSTGKWITRDGKSSTSINFNLAIADAGKLLDRFGFPETLRRGKGKLSGELLWNGLPYSLDIPSLSGKIVMNVESGQFLKQDPGAAKLLGVLSLQALPRLLKLDFHDVFSEGLAFDGITANAVITRGVLKTDNLKMHGVAATVLMDGTADIANESTRLHVVVIPEFNLGTGPLVYALAVNPVIGLGSFLAQLFLRAPVMKALTYEMQIDGPWKAPIITKLDGSKLGTVAPAPIN